MSERENHNASGSSFWRFWTTLPGFLTALATLLTAIGGLYGADQAGIIGPQDPPPPPPQVTEETKEPTTTRQASEETKEPTATKQASEEPKKPSANRQASEEPKKPPTDKQELVQIHVTHELSVGAIGQEVALDIDDQKLGPIALDLVNNIAEFNVVLSGGPGTYEYTVSVNSKLPFTGTGDSGRSKGRGKIDVRGGEEFVVWAESCNPPYTCQLSLKDVEEVR